jgi:hypothetical protein
VSSLNLRRFVPVGFVFLSMASHAIDFSWLMPSRDHAELPDAAFTSISLESNPGTVAWGNPLDGGAIRALFIAPRFTLGDVRNVAAQLELEPEIVAFWDANTLGRPENFPPIAGTSVEETLGSLRSRLDEEFDVIVLANLDLTLLPAADFDRITEKVAAGAGLVLTHHRKTTSPALQDFFAALKPTPDGGIVTRGIGHQITPEWESGVGFIQAGQFGEGRVVELDFPGPRPETHCLIPSLARGLEAEWEHLDVYLSMAARAIRWAAKRDPETAIARVDPEPLPAPSAAEVPAGLETEVEGDALDLIRRQLIRPFIVQLESPASKEYTVRTRVRRPGMGAPVIAKPTIVKEGETSTRVYLAAGSGEYYLDVWLLDDDEVVDWFTEAVFVDAWPVINNLTLNRSTLLSQDTLGISYTMPPRSRPAAVLFRATDPLNRIVAESFVRVAPENGLVKGSLDLNDLIAGPLKVEVFAVDRDAEFFTEWDTTYAAYAFRQVPVQLGHRERTLGLIAPIDGSPEYNARGAYDVLAKTGITGAHTKGTTEAVAFLAETGLDPVARVAQYTPDRIVDGAVREPCFSDPDWLNVESVRLAATSDFVRFAGATRLSLGDGNCLTEGSDPVCQSASAVDAYWEYLRHEYGSSTVAANVKTDHENLESFDQWIDFRSFMDTVFAGRHTDARRLIRELDNRLIVGFVARPESNAFTGYDWGQLVPTMDWLAIPNEPLVVEKTRSYSGDALRVGLSIPSILDERNPARERWFPWYAALHGIEELWLPPVLATGSIVVSAPLVAPDGDPILQAPELFNAARSVSSGHLRFLHDARRDTSGIAVYDSRASFFLNHAETSFGCDSPTAESSFIELIRRLGYQFDFVSARDVVDGRLSEYRVLVLPMVRAMSDAEVNAVRSFHASGGSIVADLVPGTFNEHGVPRPAPPLDDVFGVRHAIAPRAGAAADALIQIDLGAARVSGSFTGIVPDAGVEAVDAAIGGLAGSSPVWLIRQSTGISALINHSLPQTGESATMLATLLDVVLKAGGAEKFVHVDGPGGGRFRGEVFSYNLDGNRLVALLADPDADEQNLRIALPASEAHFDALKHRRITRSQKISAKLAGGAVALYGVLPYDVTGIALDTLPTVTAGERLPMTIGIGVRKGEPSTHVVHIELLSLQTDAAESIPHYALDLVCRAGQGEGFIRLALNERPGVYKLVARDVLTGMTAEAVVKIVASSSR